ncbi:MAG: homocysteine S-methyltransferase [Microbacteriaceae bacterium]|nr:homocysteine S-methyltransferase [Microbacteriaceae bacterium]
MNHSTLTAPIVLDGGLGSHLEETGHDLSGALWSARLLIDEPSAIRDAHRDYFAAGAMVAISSSYQVSFEGLATIGIDAAQGEDLLRRSVDLAREARDANRPDGLVAASVGPYGAARADGSEYTGEYDLDRAGLRRWHERRLAVLADTSADLLAIETIPTREESRALLDLIAGSGVTAWLSFTVSDGRLRDGGSLAAAFADAEAIDEIVAVGINCSHPDEVAGAIREARRSTGKAIVVYPNSGETWNAATRRWEGDAGPAPDRIALWRDAGATAIGGCCRVGPSEIARIAIALRGESDD